MKNIISFVSVKGGVGKTTLALEVASSLVNNYKKKVLLVDANFSAPNIGLYLDLTNDLSLHDAFIDTPLHNTIYEAHGIDIIPSSMYHKKEIDTSKLKKLLEKFRNRYDFIILDSSPNYEELKPVIETADKIFVVTSPDHVTLETSIKSAELAKEQNTPIEGIIVNRIRLPSHEYNINQIESFSDIPVVARIKDNKTIVKSMYHKKPITIHQPNNEISLEIKRLASAISGEPEIKNSFLKRILTNNLISKERVNREILRQRFYTSQIK